MERLLDQCVVPPGKKISLKRDFDPGAEPRDIQKKDAAELLRGGVARLAELQEMLYAQDRWSVLVIFQAMDAAGKDGTIKHVMSGINPQGCQVFSFKAPTSEELDHDYLWRCSKALPERGRIGIFNRSYYEEVLITKVHPEIIRGQKLPDQFKDKRIYERRYEEINNFEKYLSNNGVKIVKFFLNVSRQEQKKRFLERLEEPEKNWKFSHADVREREHWDEYMQAYQDCLNATSTRWAPWHVIPADAKWFTRLAVAAILYHTLEGLDLRYPNVTDEQRRLLSEARQLLLAQK
ncbi:MAG: polyphosphate kinase 2 family protein [Bryobacteraceae bacterium]|nr:polyphosphate kinase 2 family protein [Bryobacteraceae bacterium]